MRGCCKLLTAMLLTIGVMSQTATAQKDESKTSKFDTLVKGMKKEVGLWTIYSSDQKVYLHLQSKQMSKNYIILASIAKGISKGMVLGGMTWDIGGDAIWTFKKVGKKIHVLRKNVRYKAKTGTPEAEAVKLAYSDSILYALPILDETGGYLVDITRVFLSDDLRIGTFIGRGFRYMADRSTVAKVKSYPKNLEMRVNLVYSGMGGIETVEDTRGVQVGVHYSISELTSTGYKPRKADDRVGYFMTVIKDFSDKDDDRQFLRYITRWNLQKADAKAKLSPPKEPIIFYMEKTLPISLRPHVQAGIEEWNKAFRKIGFANAIQVRQQRKEDTWDPEDVRYNTFRWITAEAGFAMGPSRINPFTGQILDADIIFDASFMRYWREDYETLTDAHLKRLFPPAPVRRAKPTVAEAFGPHAVFKDFQLHRGHGGHTHDCALCRGMQHQMSYSAAALLVKGAVTEKGKLPDEFIHQAIKEVTMHEVGHTLGLRHNFKASSWKTVKEMDAADASTPTVASVMDYSPANIVPPGGKQGLYYTQTIGPYDEWAIEYGYKELASAKEKAELAKIASRGAEKGLDYATDEDTRGIDSDPLTNRFDLGKNPLEFIERQMTLVEKLMPKVVDRAVKEGQGYQRARQAFGMLLSEYWRSAMFAARFPGGVHVHRDHKGDKNARPPFRVVDVKQQRAAMKLLTETVLSAPKYDPKTLNFLAATRWEHWGMQTSDRLDYPIYDVINRMQRNLLSRLTSSLVLERLRDSELKVAANADAYTLAEHIRAMVESIFAEFTPPKNAGKYTNRAPYINGFRRNLQRLFVKKLADMVTSSGAPEDARTLARMHLKQADTKITGLLRTKRMKLDDYSRAHLMDTQDRIRKVLESKLTVPSVR